MTIKKFKQLTLGKKLNMRLAFLLFGGQGTVWVSLLEYNPSKHQLKLKWEPKEDFKSPATIRDIMVFPENTKILMEGYPGDDNNPQEWVTPRKVERIGFADNTEGLLFSIH